MKSQIFIKSIKLMIKSLESAIYYVLYLRSFAPLKLMFNLTNKYKFI